MHKTDLQKIDEVSSLGRPDRDEQAPTKEAAFPLATAFSEGAPVLRVGYDVVLARLRKMASTK
jgi:hypothetical protein